VRTSSFAEEISDVLAAQEIDIPAGAIQGGIAADNERSVMVLYLSWHDAGQLEAIAQAATTVLQERSAEYFPQFGTRGVDVVVLDEPVIAPVPPPISVRFEPLVRFGLGLVAGVALAFLVEYLDPTVHRRTEVEEMGLPVLAEIPRD
jgi:capsular polysaccharide biosynthesis protein